MQQTTRREWLTTAGSMAAAGFLASKANPLHAAEGGSAFKVAMCDWMMNRMDPASFEMGKKIGLDGIEVSVGFPADGLKLRRPEVQKQYLDAARASGLAIPSTAMSVLNHVPLASEPRAALWVADTIEVTKNLGAKAILLAFFGRGELKADNRDDMRRVIEVLKELAPRAEKAGVILGLETYLTAEAHLEIIDAVKSPALQVYYDVFNADHKGHDAIKEIKLLGKQICQVHFKEGNNPLGAGKIDWPAVAVALKEINYKGWLVLETSSPKDPIADSQKNAAYLRKLFT